jgi:hypothetical protein
VAFAKDEREIFGIFEALLEAGMYRAVVRGGWEYLVHEPAAAP